MLWYDPPFNSAARSSALNKLSAKSDSEKIEDLPAPGGPAMMTIRGWSSTAEIAIPALFHVGRHFLKKQIALRIENAPLPEFIPFCSDAFQPCCEDLIVKCIKFGIIVQVHVLNGQAFGDGHRFTSTTFYTGGK
jgi:hypothetical protein